MRPSLLVAALLLVGGIARADVVADVRGALAAGDVVAARRAWAEAHAAEGDSPAVLEARSWLARGALAAHRLDEAQADARATREAATKALGQRPLDAEPRLPIALGAAFEVEAQVLAARGERARAVTLLKDALGRFGDTSIAMRLRKNLNLMTLEGALAPELEREPHLGAAVPTLTSLRGQPVLLFFWAYWCPDCKAMVPTVAALARELAPKGLVLIAPTQSYGAPLATVEEVRHRAYAALGEAPTPISDANFARWGASSMPTIVVIDRAGKVALYHPGAMSYRELQPILVAAAAAPRR
jgi:thiol-disulfide isomerase/thioredoxin